MNYPTENETQTVQTIAQGIARYCCELIAIGDSDSTEEALDDTEHNALCLEQISKGLAMLTEILDLATLTAAA